MKKILQLSIFVIIGQFSSTGFAADGWSDIGSILGVRPEIHRTGDEGGYPIVVYTNINSVDCGTAKWAIRSDIDDGNRIYSAVLAAYAAGKKVRLYQWACYTVGSETFAKIGGVVMHDQY